MVSSLIYVNKYLMLYETYAETTNSGGTQKPDNPLKGFQDMVQDRTRIQLPRGLIVPA